jgi:hypothetical protein
MDTTQCGKPDLRILYITGVLPSLLTTFSPDYNNNTLHLLKRKHANKSQVLFTSTSHLHLQSSRNLTRVTRYTIKMQYATTFTLALGLASTASAHMKMSQPAPFGSPNNSPLAADGSDFPCKVGPSYSYDNTPATNMALGSTQPLEFIGSAVHGGGSCQVSITYDKNPTKNSVFKVIHTIEGGCPARNVAGNLPDNANGVDPDTYSFQVPTSLPTGSATIAWTWFNKIGNREMYMNCGPINLTGGSSKRDEILEERNTTELIARDQAAFNALPDMFVANVGNGCGTVETTDLIFPQPGDSVEKLAATPSYGNPTGNCAVAAAAATASPAGPASPASPTTTSSPSAGVFATAAPTTTATVFSQPSPQPAAATQPSPQPAATSQTSPQPTDGSSPTSSGGALSGPCTPEGQWNCIGGTSFQRCASGSWSIAQSVASGTQCTPGQSSSITITANSGSKKKRAGRSVRFSQEHARRYQRGTA